MAWLLDVAKIDDAYVSPSLAGALKAVQSTGAGAWRWQHKHVFMILSNQPD